jgi:hypothetical protein
LKRRGAVLSSASYSFRAWDAAPFSSGREVIFSAKLVSQQTFRLIGSDRIGEGQ